MMKKLARLLIIVVLSFFTLYLIFLSVISVSIGFANDGVNEPHLHKRMTEIYFMACGTVEMRVDMQTIVLTEKDVIVVEPGEAHTFLSSSPDHFHFVIQVPGLVGEEAKVDKVLVPHSQLGLK